MTLINEIVFTLDHDNRIVVQLEHSLNDIHCCYRAPIIFLSNDVSYRICQRSIQDSLETFVEKLTKALNSQLKLHESITMDIGYLCNESGQEKSSVTYTEDGLWVGWDNKLWASGKPNLDTWLYNNKNGEIILEITPSYKWHNPDLDRGADYIPYEEWIKSYKPLLIRTIPTDVAKQWLEQADEIVKKIDENIARMQQENSHDQH